MNAASAIVLTAVVALAALAVRRCLRKGMPCACGCDPRDCPCKGDRDCACASRR